MIMINMMMKTRPSALGMLDPVIESLEIQERLYQGLEVGAYVNTNTIVTNTLVWNGVPPLQWPWSPPWSPPCSWQWSHYQAQPTISGEYSFGNRSCKFSWNSTFYTIFELDWLWKECGSNLTSVFWKRLRSERSFLHSAFSIDTCRQPWKWMWKW